MGVNLGTPDLDVVIGALEHLAAALPEELRLKLASRPRKMHFQIKRRLPFTPFVQAVSSTSRSRSVHLTGVSTEAMDDRGFIARQKVNDFRHCPSTVTGFNPASRR